MVHSEIAAVLMERLESERPLLGQLPSLRAQIGKVVIRKVDRLSCIRTLGIGSHWPFVEWGRFLPEHATAVSLLDRLLHHANVVATQGESHRMKQARTRGARTTTTTT